MKYQGGVTTSVPDSKDKFAPAGKEKGHPLQVAGKSFSIFFFDAKCV